MEESGGLSDEKGLHIGVTCSGLLRQWRVVVSEQRQPAGQLFCDLRFDLEEMMGFVGLLLHTARVLEIRQRDELVGAVIAGLHELEPRVRVRVEE